LILSSEGKKLEKIKGNVVLDGLSFTYPSRPDAPVLRKFSVSIEAGQIVALVGPSGCGKSSVVGLLQRFYLAQEGRILIDDIPIEDFNVRWFRQNVGLVSQEPILFSGTIGENISYGKENATQEEIEDAAKAANAHNFITSFPDGYKTEVGEKGVQLSGGQKQRIAIARAIIKNPSILLLDEATSALDAESESVVQEALDTVMQGRTTIVIAHRLSTIRHANKICVIDGGKIVEEGTHEQLLEMGGLYSNLVSHQTA